MIKTVFAHFVMMAASVSAVAQSTASPQCVVYGSGDERYATLKPVDWALGDPNPNGVGRTRFHSSRDALVSTSFSQIYALSWLTSEGKAASSENVYLDIHHVAEVKCNPHIDSDSATLCLADYCRFDFRISAGNIRNPQVYVLSAGDRRDTLRRQPVCVVSAIMFMSGEHGAWGKIDESDFSYSDTDDDWLLASQSQLMKCILQKKARSRAS